MQYLSDYKLECEANGDRRKYDLLSNVSMLMKIAALLTLIGMLWHFWVLYIAIAVWMASMVVNYLKRRLAYRYIYLYSAGALSVFKEFQDKKREYLVDVPLQEIKECQIIDKLDVLEGFPLYLDENALYDHIVCIETSTLKFYIVADDYLYSLLQTERI